MTKLICKNCGFRFEKEKQEKKAKCPYCDKEGLEREQSAEELIESVE